MPLADAAAADEPAAAPTSSVSEVRAERRRTPDVNDGATTAAIPSLTAAADGTPPPSMPTSGPLLPCRRPLLGLELKSLLPVHPPLGHPHALLLLGRRPVGPPGVGGPQRGQRRLDTLLLKESLPLGTRRPGVPSNGRRVVGPHVGAEARDHCPHGGHPGGVEARPGGRSNGAEDIVRLADQSGFEIDDKHARGDGFAHGGPR